MTKTSLPRLLVALRAHLSNKEDVFGDWQFARCEPVAKLHPPSEADIVRVAAEGIVPIAGDFSGGLLLLDLRAGDPERAAVVAYDSGATVLGESFDDFLALLASDEPDPQEDCWTASDALRAWIRAIGIHPHPSAKTRLVELTEATRLFRVDWAMALRRATTSVRPKEQVDHLLVPGERIGAVCIGMSRDALDAQWGTPEFPTWGSAEDHVLALYPDRPFSVKLDPSRTRVIGATLFSGRHRAVTSEGVEPLLMRAADVMERLARLGLRAVQEPLSIAIPDVGLSFSLTTMRGAGESAPWVDAITLTERAS